MPGSVDNSIFGVDIVSSMIHDYVTSVYEISTSLLTLYIQCEIGYIHLITMYKVIF